MAHRADGLNDIFDNSVEVKKRLITNEGAIHTTPTSDLDIANKKYVDAQIAGVDEHDELGHLDYASAGHTGFAPALGADDNYVTDAEKIVIGNTSGTNTGDNAGVTSVTGTSPVASSGGTTPAISMAAATNAAAGHATAAHITAIEANTAHAADNTQAHSDYLLNSANDIGVGLTLTGDETTVSQAFVRNIVVGTSATPSTASDFSQGTIYVQYTA